MIFAAAAALLPALAAPKGSNSTRVGQQLTTFSAIVRELQSAYVDTLDCERDVRNAIDAMLGQIDPYTEYYPAQEQDALRQLSSGEFSGIGSTIMQRNGKVVLSDPQWGSPARKAGVRHGDVLVAIDGDTLPQGYSTSEASKRLRGQAGTKVRVTVNRPYTADSIFDIDIVRGTIRTAAVPYYGMLGDSVGYVRLTTFSESSASDVRQAVQALRRENPAMRGLVLDLRDNGGGLLESAVQIVGLFVPRGTEVVTVRYREAGREKKYKTTQQPIEPQVPLAVLVNGGTASASEIVSGSLQDLDRAVIVGERSFGKGLVQTSRPLPYNGMLKLTVGRYYIPSGRLIQAIDYSHRNADGSAARVPDSLTTVFHTVAGREVRDGGGITPDAKVELPDVTRLIYNAVSDMWVYDYATRFAARQGSNMPAAADFEVSDSIYADFKGFIDPDRFEYDKLCESGIKYLREAAQAEGYMTDSVAAQFNVLEQMLRHDLGHDLDRDQAVLSKYIDDEISARYYSEAEQVMRSLRGDSVVGRAAQIVCSPEYREILSAPVAGK